MPPKLATNSFSPQKSKKSNDRVMPDSVSDDDVFDDENGESRRGIAIDAVFQKIPEYVKMIGPASSDESAVEGIRSIRQLIRRNDPSPINQLGRTGGLRQIVELLCRKQNPIIKDDSDKNEKSRHKNANDDDDDEKEDEEEKIKQQLIINECARNTKVNTNSSIIQIQHNSLMCLSDLALNDPAEVSSLVAKGVISAIVALLTSPFEKVRCSAATCLEAVIHDNIAQSRAKALAAGAMQAALQCINEFPNRSLRTIRNATLLVSELCREKNPALDKVECCLPTMKRLLLDPVFAESLPDIQTFACWTIAFVTDQPASQIIAIQKKYEVFADVATVLRSQRASVVEPSVRAFGNLTLHAETSQMLRELNVLGDLRPLLHDSFAPQVRKEICFLVSNFCCGVSSHHLDIKNAFLYPMVIQNLYCNQVYIRREAAHVIFNASGTGSRDADFVRFLLNDCHNLVDALVVNLRTPDATLIKIILKAVYELYKAAEQLHLRVPAGKAGGERRGKHENLLLDKFEKAGGLEALRGLMRLVVMIDDDVAGIILMLSAKLGGI